MRDILVYIRDGENEELRYAVRSWVKNLEFSRIFAVGTGNPPSWFNPDKYITAPKVRQAMSQPIINLEAALDDEDLGEDIIILMDDVFVMHPIPDRDWNWNRGTLMAHWSGPCKGSCLYTRQVKNTDMFLRMVCDFPLDFEEHTPFFCKKSLLKEVMSDYRRKFPSILWRSLYGNIYPGHTEFKRDIKILNNYESLPSDEICISTSDDTFRYSPAGDALHKHFTIATKYELC